MEIGLAAAYIPDIYNTLIYHHYLPSSRHSRLLCKLIFLQLATHM